MSLYTVSKLLGHQTIQITEIYAHLAPEHLQKAVTNLPKHNEPTLHLEEKTVTTSHSVCRQISSDFSEFVKKD